MTEPIPDPDAQRYVLRAQTPLRALLIASGCEIVGAILLVVADALGLSVLLTVLGALLLAFGGAVLLAAVLAFGRLAQTVELGTSGVTLRRRSATTTLDWPDITEVTLQDRRLVLHTAAGAASVMEIRNPGGGATRTFAALTEDLRVRLDADRGYGPLEPGGEPRPGG